jgi:hypothetical protein
MDLFCLLWLNCCSQASSLYNSTIREDPAWRLMAAKAVYDFQKVCCNCNNGPKYQIAVKVTEARSHGKVVVSCGALLLMLDSCIGVDDLGKRKD